MRGENLWQTARQFADMPQELEHLQRAADAYRQAQELYAKIPAFPGVAGSMRRSQRALDRIAERVAELSMDIDEDRIPELTLWR
jgi:hypothetical protein